MNDTETHTEAKWFGYFESNRTYGKPERDREYKYREGDSK